MSKLVSRILLAVLMLPAATTIFMIVYLQLDSRYFRRLNRDMVWLGSGGASFAFVAVYWFMLWRGSVNWTAKRKFETTIITLGSLMVGLLTVVAMKWTVDPYRADWVGPIIVPALWLIATTLVWRESPDERKERLLSLNSGGVVCPACGYNMTGLQGTRCPECGLLHTLDELLASQPGRADDEVAG